MNDLVEMLSPDEDKIGDLKIKKPTAGTLSLCDFAKLKMTSGGISEVPFFEAVAFFYIHSQDMSEVRGKLFDKSQGVTEDGCSLAFINAVTDWGDSVELGTIGEMGDKISSLLTEAMSPKVEPDQASSDGTDISNVVAEQAEDAKKKDHQPIT
jgi:hypothetical protein